MPGRANRQPNYPPNSEPEGYYPSAPQQRGLNRNYYTGPGWGRRGRPAQPYAQPQAEEEGNAFTRQWVTDPPRGQPTLSTRNIELTKAAIERYRTIVENAADPIFIADPRGNLTWVNQAMCSQLGFLRQELQGLNLGKIAKKGFAHRLFTILRE